MFRDFKRHYHKVTEAYSGLAGKGSFSLQINFDGNNLYAESKIPDEEATVRFVVLMRRFLNPSDSLYHKKTWATLQGQFADEVSNEITTHVEALFERLSKGHFGVNINGEDLTAERIYQVLSEGEYFDNKDEARRYLQGLVDMPVIGPLFWYQFYEYTLAGFALASTIFDLVSRVEQSAKYKALHGERSVAESRCIYCLTTTGSFMSEEHIFPESLGNDELVLPKGHVCDRCNNEVLSGLDEALINFGPVAFLRVQFVPYTKEGKLPKANFQNLSMRRTGPRNITIIAKDKTARIKDKKHLGDNWYSFRIDTRGRKFNPVLLGRALYKIALGTVALSQGRELACSSKYDAAREFIRTGQGVTNNLLMRMVSRPHPQVHIAYQDTLEGTPFVIDIYGLMFLLNLENAPELEFNEILTQSDFQLFSLRVTA
ncbi:MAG: hypothetical protein NT169_14510 [Chloroflexi bacterium]|nr:hypothetical protein [Chloroflexota bacterium]